MNKNTFTIEFLLEWDDLSPSGQQKVLDALESPVGAIYGDQIKEETDQEWNEASDEMKKNFGYDRMFMSNHMNKVYEVAQLLRDYVGMEVRIWKK